MKKLEDRITDIVATQLRIKKEKMTPDSHFTRDLGADSIDIVSVMMRFEEVFNVAMVETEAKKLATVHEIVAYLRQRGVA